MPFLNQADVVEYLRQRNLLTSQAIVDGELCVVDASQRHSNFKVIARRGPSYLVKQGVDQERIAQLQREAWVYRRFAALDETCEIRQYTPRFHAYDAEHHVLVLALLPDAGDLREHYGARGAFSPGHARALGRALGALHSLRLEAGTPDEGDTSPAWGCAIYDPDGSLLQQVSRANLRVVSLIQQLPDFCQLLADVPCDWRPTAFIHSDVRWANCLLAAASASGRRRVILVDWELACAGDPCWDVGCLLSEYLSWWIHSIPITSPRGLGQLPPSARQVLSNAQQSLGAFWQSYSRRLALDDPSNDERLVRAVRFCAVRLVQAAYEEMQFSTDLTATVACQLQVSLNILKRPDEALAHLCGLQLAS